MKLELFFGKCRIFDNPNYYKEREMIFLKPCNKQQATRYLIVRFASRGGDIAIYAAILYVYGVASLPYAFTISTIYDYTLDFFGQKFWTFGNRFEYSWGFAKEFGIYLLARGGIVILAAICYYIITTWFSVPVPTALVFTFAVFLPIAFICYKKIFLSRIHNSSREDNT